MTKNLIQKWWEITNNWVHFKKSEYEKNRKKSRRKQLPSLLIPFKGRGRGGVCNYWNILRYNKLNTLFLNVIILIIPISFLQKSLGEFRWTVTTDGFSEAQLGVSEVQLYAAEVQLYAAEVQLYIHGVRRSVHHPALSRRLMPLASVCLGTCGTKIRCPF